MLIHFFGLPVDERTARMLGNSDYLDTSQLRVLRVHAVTPGVEDKFFVCPNGTVRTGILGVAPAQRNDAQLAMRLVTKCRTLAREALSDAELAESTLTAMPVHQPLGEWYTLPLAETEDMSEFAL
jgi:hypothetical protein